MPKFFSYIAIIAIIFGSCYESKINVLPYLKARDADSLIVGLNKVKKNDTGLVRIILENPYDPRGTFVSDYKGQTVYQAKMNALQRISNLAPPVKITYRPDSSVIAFYTNWASERGYLANDDR